ncbi:MAG: potassium channel protein [bacterium]
MSSLRQRLGLASLLLVMIMVTGIAGYSFIEGWSFFDSFYMTVISLTTVGYNETRELTTNGRIFTIFLLFGGMGILAYGVGTFTAFLVEGHLSDILRIRKMQKRINSLKGHVILCGHEAEGRYVLEEFIKTKTPYVVVTKDVASLKEAFPNEEMLVIEGDPTKEAVLGMANLENANGLVSALSSDSENLLVVLSAREMSPNLRIISSVFDRENLHKFQRVGADGTVMATFIGGLRMASEVIRPTVVSFLDAMLREKDKTLRIEEVQIPGNDCPWVGKSLRDIDFPKQTGLVIVAVKSPKSEKYIYNPRGDFVVEEGDTLIVIGGLDQIFALRRMLGHVVDGDGQAGGAEAAGGKEAAKAT